MNAHRRASISSSCDLYTRHKSHDAFELSTRAKHNRKEEKRGGRGEGDIEVFRKVLS